jgi:hypothetical protein
LFAVQARPVVVVRITTLSRGQLSSSRRKSSVAGITSAAPVFCWRSRTVAFSPQRIAASRHVERDAAIRQGTAMGSREMSANGNTIVAISIREVAAAECLQASRRCRLIRR